MQFSIDAGLKLSPFDPHSIKPRIVLTDMFKENKSYLSDQTTLNVSVQLKQIQIYWPENEKDRWQTLKWWPGKEKNACCTSQKSRMGKSLKPVTWNV